MLLTNTGSQGLELPLLGASLGPPLDNNALGGVHGAGPAPRPRAVTAGLAPSALLASEPRLLAEPSVHVSWGRKPGVWMDGTDGLGCV